MYKRVSELAPHISELKGLLLPPFEESERYRIASFELEALPYALGAAQYHLYQCYEAQHALLKKYDGRQLKGPLHLGQPERDRLGFPIDGFLESAIRAQNALQPYLQRAFHKSLKKSLSRIIAKVEAGKISFDPVIDGQLTSYWKACGEKLKHYRDVSQHHAVVSSDVHIFESDGVLGVYLLLPSNPEAKKTGLLSYGNPPIHALEYVRKEFFKLVVLIDLVTRYVAEQQPGGVTPDGTRTFRMSVLQPREPITLGKVSGIRLLDHSEVEARLSHVLSRQNERYGKMVGQS